MRHGVRLSRFSATTLGKACSLRGGAALPTSCIRTAPSPHHRPSQLFHLYYLHAPTSTPFSLAPCKHQSASSRSHIGHTSLPPPFLPTNPPGPILLPLHDDRPARSLHGSHEFEQWLSRPTMLHYRRASTSRIPSSTHDLQNPPSPNFPHPLPSRHTTSPLHTSPPPDPDHRHRLCPNGEKASRS